MGQELSPTQQVRCPGSGCSTQGRRAQPGPDSRCPAPSLALPRPSLSPLCACEGGAGTAPSCSACRASAQSLLPGPSAVETRPGSPLLQTSPLRLHAWLLPQHVKALVPDPCQPLGCARHRPLSAGAWPYARPSREPLSTEQEPSPLLSSPAYSPFLPKTHLFWSPKTCHEGWLCPLSPTPQITSSNVTCQTPGPCQAP